MYYEPISCEGLMNKIRKLGAKDVHFIGYPTRLFPVNLSCTMEDGLRFYVANIRDSGWSIEYTREDEVIARVNMIKIRGFKNQTETLKAIKKIVSREPFTLGRDGKVE